MTRHRMHDCDFMRGARVLDLPAEAQALYMNLIDSADDDGFVPAPKCVAKGYGKKEKYVKTLIDNGFLIPFDGGSVVVITHWHMHNTIRRDMYHPTLYAAELAMLTLLKNGTYVLKDSAENVTQTVTENGTENVPLSEAKRSKEKKSKAISKRSEEKSKEEKGETDASQDATQDAAPASHAAQRESSERKPFGENGNVLLTSEEHRKFCEDFPECCEAVIQRADVYIATAKNTVPPDKHKNLLYRIAYDDGERLKAAASSAPTTAPAPFPLFEGEQTSSFDAEEFWQAALAASDKKGDELMAQLHSAPPQ